jgi:hypothetical protein
MGRFINVPIYKWLNLEIGHLLMVDFKTESLFDPKV